MRSRSTRATRTRTSIRDARTLHAGITGRRRRFSSARKLEITSNSALARRDLRVRGRVPRTGGQIRRRCVRLSEGARGKSGQPDGARRRHAAVRIHASLDHRTGTGRGSRSARAERGRTRFRQPARDHQIPSAPNPHRLRQHTEHDAGTRNRISCDDAAAAVIETSTPGIGEIRSSTVANQDDIHRAYGGIVPELASRNHVVTIAPVIERALAPDAGSPTSRESQSRAAPAWSARCWSA